MTLLPAAGPLALCASRRARGLLAAIVIILTLAITVSGCGPCDMRGGAVSKHTLKDGSTEYHCGDGTVRWG